MPGSQSSKANRILLLFLTGMLVLSSIPLVHAAAPVAGFSYSPAAPSTADTIYFNSTSTDDFGNITNYTWDMGDGTLLYGADVTHQYADNGTYTVVLNITDNETFYDTYSELVTVLNVGPMAEFSYDPAAPSTADTVTFTDNSSDNDGTITNWTWDFGDGNSSYLQSPTHRYADDGSYNVTLTVMDDDGATDALTIALGVSNRAPIASFTATPTDLETGGNVTFTDTSTDADGTIANWTWNFGDGNGSYLRNDVHSYTEDGNYTVTLTVTDDDGATNSTTRTVNVSNRMPTANFTYSPAQILTTINATFTANATDVDGTIASYDWDFGDGTTTQSGTIVSHDFNGTGTFLVTLTVTDDDGATFRVNQSVAVHGGGGGTVFGPPEVRVAALKDPSNPERWILSQSVFRGTETVTIDIPDASSPVDAITIAVKGHGTLSIALEHLTAPHDLPGSDGYALDHPLDIDVKGDNHLDHMGGIIHYALDDEGFDLTQMSILHGTDSGYEPLTAEYRGLDSTGRHILSVPTTSFSPFVLARDVESPLVDLKTEQAMAEGAALIFEITDNRGISGATLSIDGTETPLQNEGALYWVDTSRLAAGLHEADLQVTDLSGLVTSKTWTFELLGEAPAPATTSEDPEPREESSEQDSRESPSLGGFALGFGMIAVAWIVLRRM